MAVPDFLKRETDNIIDSIEKQAAIYTPEWIFSEEHMDMGSMLALLFADMMQDTLESFYGLPERYQIQFYNLLGANQQPPTPARGYVTFSTVNDEVMGSYVEEGMEVSGSGENSEQVLLETLKEIYVSPARLKSLFYLDGKTDYISPPILLPFILSGQDNRQSHVLYVGHDTALPIMTEGELMLDFHIPDNIRGKKNIAFLQEKVCWSYHSSDGYVEFPNPRFEGGRVFLQKSRSMPSFCRTEMQESETYWIKMEVKTMEPESHIEFPGLSLCAAGTRIEPELIYDGNMELYAEHFLPFGEQPYPYAELYIASNEVFSRKGASISMNLEIELEEYDTRQNIPDMPLSWHTVMHKKEFDIPEPVNITVDSVIWEYYNGFGWTKLPGSARYENLFREQPEDVKFIISFTCPDDIKPFLLSSGEYCCIRMRVVKMQNLYAMNGIYQTPCIKKLTLDYHYEGGMAPQATFAVNQLRTKQLTCSREFIPFYSDFSADRMFYLCFSKPLSEAGIRLLFMLEKENMSPINQCRYEFYGKEGWSLLQVEDETFDLTQTGLVSFQQSHNFYKHTFFEEEGYWMRIVMENPDMDIPDIRGIYLNSTTVCTKGDSGKQGNLSSGAVDKMERHIGFINQVTNYGAVFGGCDREPYERAVRRMASTLRHQERAVTAKDYEDIVYGGVRDILQVCCFSGRDEKGEVAPGHIALAILSPEDESTSFTYWKERVYQCLKPYVDRRLYEEGRLHIVEPERVTMKVYMTAVVDKSYPFYQMKETISQRINAFLDPTTGNFDGKGWRIGTLPTVMQIQNICNQISGLLYVRSISLQDTSKGCYVLGLGKKHEIEVIPE